MSLLIHIVPQLPPAISGVGDYSFLVGRKIEELRPDVRCGYVACGSRVPDNRVNSPHQRDATGYCDQAPFWRAIAELVDELAGGIADHTSLLVHYSGYGFHPVGAPRWLADALKRPPRPFSRVRISSMFHELYATSWPWKRAFWSSSRQRLVAMQIAQLSNTLITNREQSARWLEQVTGRATGSVVSIPVPSNVGEPEEVPSWAERLPRAVTFGGAQSKRFALSTRSKDMATLLAKLGITELVDIGARIPIDREAFQARGIRTQQLGFCHADRVSNLLLQSRIGLVDYPFDFLPKSSVVAAYAAHGLAIFLNADRRKGNRDASFPANWLDHLESSATQIRNWYLGHRLAEHARIIMQLTTPTISGVHA